MGYDFASAKELVRRTTHAVFGVQAFYVDDSISIPVETRARLHDRIMKPIGGSMDGETYAGIVEGADRIIFYGEDIEGFPLSVKRGGVFTFPLTMPDEEFVLEVKEPGTGGTQQTWQVTRRKK